MSRIDQMIIELCPNGVEYKQIKDVCVLSRGVRVVKSELMDHGVIPVYQNSLKPLGFNGKSNRRSGMSIFGLQTIATRLNQTAALTAISIICFR